MVDLNYPSRTCLDIIFLQLRQDVRRKTKQNCRIEMKKSEMANMFQSSCAVTIIKMPAEEVNSMGEVPFSPFSLGRRFL